MLEVIKSCSPKKKAKLRERGISVRSVAEEVVSNIKNSMNCLKTKRKSTERRKLAVIVRAINSNKPALIKRMGMRLICLTISKKNLTCGFSLCNTTFKDTLPSIKLYSTKWTLTGTLYCRYTD